MDHLRYFYLVAGWIKALTAGQVRKEAEFIVENPFSIPGASSWDSLWDSRNWNFEVDYWKRTMHRFLHLLLSLFSLPWASLSLLLPPSPYFQPPHASPTTTPNLPGPDGDRNPPTAPNPLRPEEFPKSHNGLWYAQPGTVWSKDWLPAGNGVLGGMLPGGTTQETTQLNIESLWTGGPFADPTYNGGNKNPAEREDLARVMKKIREEIFGSRTGEIANLTRLATDPGEYGSYTTAGMLVASFESGRPNSPTSSDKDSLERRSFDDPAWPNGPTRRSVDETTWPIGPTDSKVSNYARWLDMETHVVRTKWTQAGVDFLRTTFCSNPSGLCIQHLAYSYDFSTSSPHAKTPLPNLRFTYVPPPAEDSTIQRNITFKCQTPSSLLISSTSNRMMSYAFLFRAFVSPGSGGRVDCVPGSGDGSSDAALIIHLAEGDQGRGKRSGEAYIAWDATTAYDMDAGDESHGFTFRAAVEPVEALLRSSVLSSSTSSDDQKPQPRLDYANLFAGHVRDVQALGGGFALELGPPSKDSSWEGAIGNLTTDALLKSYVYNPLVDSASGAGTSADDGPKAGVALARNTYLEWILFNYGRYMFVSSARGKLPLNLQGVWADGVSNAWSADYHANINIQMNYWFAEMMGLGELTMPLFDYMEKTWAPRGKQTARTLYNITRGWVTHNEMNIFGHTGFKTWMDTNSALWANYPEANAWMMMHVWDHFDYSSDVSWWQKQGWPLLKGVASFHLDKLLEDTHTSDGTLVVAPCNSPEQDPITFGCAHAQQLIWELFNAVELGYVASGDKDEAFLKEVRDKRARIDRGLRIGSWGQLQEWKVDKDRRTDTHRHLSHLIGLYPGYAIASYRGPNSVDDSTLASNTGLNLTRDALFTATKTSLVARGRGIGPDADAGWEKVWRAAAWAQLGDAERYYDELAFSIKENLADNLFSVYNPGDPSPLFQIDANMGYPAALLNGLVQAPSVPPSQPLIITLLPALPPQWPSGSLKNVHLRGNIRLSLSWSNGKLASGSITLPSGRAGLGDAGKGTRGVEVLYMGRIVDKFTTGGEGGVRVLTL